MHIKAISYIYCSKASHIAFYVLSYILVWLSPFLYSSGQSSKIILGFLIVLLILGWVISLLTITPYNTSQSSRVPPGIFSTLAYLLIYKFNLLLVPALITVFVALIVRLEINFPHLLANLVPIQHWSAFKTY